MKIWKRFAAGLLTAALTLSLLTAAIAAVEVMAVETVGMQIRLRLQLVGRIMKVLLILQYKSRIKRSHGQILKRMHILAAWV